LDERAVWVAWSFRQTVRHCQETWTIQRIFEGECADNISQGFAKSPDQTQLEMTVTALARPAFSVQHLAGDSDNVAT